MENDGKELDEKKLRKLKFLIIALERNNLKTKKYRQYQMEERILKLIEREVLD